MTRLVRFSNNSVSRLAANITNASTTISLTPGDGAKFPVISGTQFFMATLIKSTGETEIVKVTARSTDTLTVVRAAEPVGATQVAYSFSAGDRIEQRLTAKALSDELDRLDSGANIGATNKTADYTVQAADVSTLIRVDTTAGAITITLPEISALADDFDIMVAKVTDNANAVNIVRAGSTDLINGATSYPVNNQWQSAWLIADRSTNTWTAINSGAATSSIAVDTFTGDGTAGPYTLSGDPVSKANTAVYLSGVYQQKATYTLSGTSLTMGGNVPVGVTVEVVWSRPLSIGRTDAGLVSYDGGTVQDVLDGAVSKADYVELRAYTGRAKRIYITGLLVTKKPAGIAGVFQYDPTDTTSADNGGSIIVGADGRRWKRDYGGNVSAAWFEAVGDGVVNDTQKIQVAVNYCIANKKNLTIPPSAVAYMIDAVGGGATPNTNGGIVINGPITIFMYGAKLKAITNSSSSYVVLNIRNASSVHVFGGAVEGDRATHAGVGGEHGHGIVITGSTDVRLQDVYVSNCWGDCVGIRTDGNTVNKRIVLDSVTCDSARRNGLTVQLVDGLVANGCRFINTNGTAPQSGVDLEPNPGEGSSKNIVFDACYFGNNTTSDVVGGGGDGIENVIIANSVFGDVVGYGVNIGGAINCKNVSVHNNSMRMRAGSVVGIVFGSGTDLCAANNNISRLGSYSSDSSAGLYVEGVSNGVKFTDNSITGCRSGVQFASVDAKNAIVDGNDVHGCFRGFYAFNVVNNISITNNTFRDLLNYGIQASFVNSEITKNSFYDLAFRGTSIGANNCIISQNIFDRVGTGDPVNEPCLGFSSAAEACTVSSNIFRGTAGDQDAIRANITPVSPSFFDGNVARHGSFAAVFIIDSSHVLGKNYSATQTSGSFTLSAAATRVVANGNIRATSVVMITPTNAAAATLMSGSKAIYVSAKTSGTSFTVSTADGTSAAGTETFDYQIVN